MPKYSQPIVPRAARIEMTTRDGTLLDLRATRSLIRLPIKKTKATANGQVELEASRVEACRQHDDGAWPRAIRGGGDRRRAIPFDDVVRRVEGGVDPPVPGIFTVVRSRRQLELERLPVRVEDRVE